MMQQKEILFALEKHFHEVAAGDAEAFPGPNDYWDHYHSMLVVLREQFYKLVNLGLAVHSGSIAGIYTDHSGDHFDEVVKYAGKLIGVDQATGNFPLSPYEVFLLLMGIRLHDVGNLYGREGHETRAIDIYKIATPSASRDRFETQAISGIAKVHGGRTPIGNKDTISQLKEVDHLGNNIKFRPRLIAAIVRFADEVCEHRGRVRQHMIDNEKIPEQNLLFHLYASAIKSSVIDRRDKAVRLDYILHKKYLLKPYTFTPDKKKYLLDETLDRLAKLNLERIYCNQFLVPELQTDRIHATITIVDGEDGETTLEQKEIDIQPRGYPTEDNRWRSQIIDFSGKAIQKKFSPRRGKRNAG